MPRGDKENYVYLVKAIIPLSTAVLKDTIVQSCQVQKALTWFKDERQMVMSRKCEKLKPRDLHKGSFSQASKGGNETRERRKGYVRQHDDDQQIIEHNRIIKWKVQKCADAQNKQSKNRVRNWKGWRAHRLLEGYTQNYPPTHPFRKKWG